MLLFHIVAQLYASSLDTLVTTEIRHLKQPCIIRNSCAPILALGELQNTVANQCCTKKS